MKLLIITLTLLGVVILNIIPTQVTAQSGPWVNWYEICKNPIVDSLITEPCQTLTTNGGYTLTPEGERVLGCLSGGAVALAIPELMSLKNVSGCGSQSQNSYSAPSAGNNLINNRQSDPIGDIINNLFG